MNVQMVNSIETRGIYQGAVVMRLDDKGRPSRLMMRFDNTPDAETFLADIYAAGTSAEFEVYESWSYPVSRSAA